MIYLIVNPNSAINSIYLSIFLPFFQKKLGQFLFETPCFQQNVGRKGRFLFCSTWKCNQYIANQKFCQCKGANPDQLEPPF